VSQGEVWWADLPAPAGSAPGFRRPAVIVQGNHLNRSRIAAVVCVPLTSHLTWARAPGNVLLPATAAGLPKESVGPLRMGDWPLMKAARPAWIPLPAPSS